MPIIDLNLPISKNKFIRWLQHYVESTRDESIPTSHGSITISNLTISGMDDLLTSAAIDGILSISDDELAAMSPGSRRLSDLYGNKRDVTRFINFRFKKNKERLNVIFSHDDPALLPYFDALVAAINDRWLKKAHEPLAVSVPTSKLDAALATTATPMLSQRPSGRPANADDEWAWCEVRLNGRSSKEVRSEWLRRIGPRADLLVDPQDSFRKAIKPNRLAKKYGRSGNSDTESAGR